MIDQTGQVVLSFQRNDENLGEEWKGCQYLLQPAEVLALRTILHVQKYGCQGSQGPEILFGHHQQSPNGILAHGLYVPAILWQGLRLKDDFRGHFFPIFSNANFGT